MYLAVTEPEDALPPPFPPHPSSRGGRNWEIAAFEACPRNCEPMMPSFDNCDNGQKGHENDICEDCKK